MSKRNIKRHLSTYVPELQAQAGKANLTAVDREEFAALAKIRQRIKTMKEPPKDASEETLLQLIESAKTEHLLLLARPMESTLQINLLQLLGSRLKGYVSALLALKNVDAGVAMAVPGAADDAKQGQPKDKDSDVEEEDAFEELKASVPQARSSVRRTTVAEVKSNLTVNRWGQVRATTSEKAVDEKTAAKDAARAKAKAAKDTEREKKWIVMNKSWDDFVKKQPAVVKSRIRKGIPESMRSIMWQKFTGCTENRDNRPGLYAELVAQEQGTFDAEIRRDIDRTFPEHVYFHGTQNKQGKKGQESLFNVLHAYSINDSEVGYCQGMGFLVGIFLMYMSEEEAFWMLESLLRSEKYGENGLSGLYSNGFPLLNQWNFVFSELLREQSTKLYNYFEKMEKEAGHPWTTFTISWFMTLFAAKLPFDCVLRVWDILLHEGVKIVFRVALFILKRAEKEILAKDPCDFHLMEKDLGTDMDPDTLISGALGINLSGSKLQKLLDKYLDSRVQ
mmetsp:Transcript_49928/g.97938  ORF Transcript_49928/g.97938 Transcript_49928/m.97938 type:complete len:506 (-) Transcript_49928:274-1791(-)